MLHKISKFCDKINSINKMAEDLRVLKYQTPKSKERDFKIQNLIETIQADCLLVRTMIKVIMKKAIMIILVLTMTTACSVTKGKNEKKYNQSIVLLGLSLVFLTNCSSMNRSHLGAVSGGATTTR